MKRSHLLLLVVLLLGGCKSGTWFPGSSSQDSRSGPMLTPTPGERWRTERLNDRDR